MDTVRAFSMLHLDEYKDNNSYFGGSSYRNNRVITKQNKNELMMERDTSLNTIHSTLPTYISYHLNFCLDHCSDRDLLSYIKWKSEHNIKQFRKWMRIIASTIAPQIDQENIIIQEWYQYLLNANHTNDNQFNSNPLHNADDLNHSDNKDNETQNDSASEEEEQYSISTELDMSPTKLPMTKNRKYV